MSASKPSIIVVTSSRLGQDCRRRYLPVEAELAMAEALWEDLLSDDAALHDLAVRRAIAAGADGEQALCHAAGLLDSGAWQRTVIIAALGDVAGQAAHGMLERTALDPAGDLDERCAALVALAKRTGTAATTVFFSCTRSGDTTLADYAALCLAYASDSDIAAQTMLSRLNSLLSEPAPEMPQQLQASTLAMQSRVLPTVIYLARTAPDVIPVRDTLRRNWHKLYTAEQQWLSLAWPATNPAVPGVGDPPQTGEMVQWLRHPLFTRIYR